MEDSSDIKSAAIILIKGDKALLQLRDNKPTTPYSHHWGFAGGGHLNEGETFLEAAQRELKEETGYTSKSPIHFMTAEYTLPDGRTVKSERYYEIYDEVQEVKCLEGEKIEFLSLEEIAKEQMYPGVAEAVEKALKVALNN
ncbi:MAG: ADP-ribose pyrophosphatase [Candidatus Nomurabacteria bacterium]|nr:ADP-ribose pyrophosphatase [Candidatus Nomurabacteria bacterium]